MRDKRYSSFDVKLFSTRARRIRNLSWQQFKYLKWLLDKIGVNGRLSKITRLPMSSGAELYILSVLSEGEIIRYYAKFHPDAHLPVASRRSFRSYKRALSMARHFEDVSSKFKVSRPIYYDIPSACLITNYAGISIRDLIIKNGRHGFGLLKKTELQNAVKGAAGWLKCFWKVTENGGRETFCMSSLNKQPWSLDNKLRLCCEAGFVTSKVAQSLRALLIEKTAKLNGIEYPLVGGHWDFRPANVVISMSRVTVIDWTTYRHCRTPYWDAAGFWADLGNISINPAVRPGLIRSLQNSFAKAIASELNSELFWVWRVEAVLYFAARDANSNKAQKLGLRRSFVNWCSRYHYKRALVELAKEAKR